MNKRIRELVRQAGLDDADFPIENWDNVPLAKFAELIVRECIDVGIKDFYNHLPNIFPANAIKQHFGVKE